MNILFVAPGSSFTNQIAAALTAEGQVVTYCDDRVDYSLPALARSVPFLWHLSRRISWWRARANRMLQEQVISIALRTGADILLATKGMNIRPETLNTLKQQGIRMVIWFPENAANEPYRSWVGRVGPLWDYFFSFDPAIHTQIPAGSSTVIRVLPFAVDPAVYATEEPTDGDEQLYRSDVCFIGAPYPDRVRLLESVTDTNLKIWGWEGWKKTSLARYWQGPLTAAQSARTYASAGVCVNTNVLPHAEGVNVKTFEIPAAGGFQLTDHVAGLSDVLTIGEEVAVFEHPEEFRGNVQYWLAHPEERHAIAAAGRARVLRDHAMRMRMRQLLAAISS